MNHRVRPVRRLLAAVTAMALGGTLLIAPTSAAAAFAPSAAAKTFRGVGDDLIRIRATKSRGIATVTHDGESNFALWTLKPNGKQDDLLVNTIGSYSGTTVFNLYPWHQTGAFEIAADGAWTLKIQPISAAPLWKTATVRNRGDKVLKLKTPTRGLRTMRYRHSGDRNFVVYAIPTSGSPDLLVNKIGAVKGKVRIPAGTKYVSVQADGPWYLVRS
ncbi:hypothetical protein AB0K60_29905 [Thermopolyspora sp. NPDC052614]|uniref:hypothetical protein n=1 Tax=Thermopolyspora sp. NPDC052614 TaxID=3155682 RepID=UPI0034386749